MPEWVRWQSATGSTHLIVSLVAGAVAVAVTFPVAGAETAGLIGWIATAGLFLAWTWHAIWPRDPGETAAQSARDDPSRIVRDVVLVVGAMGAMFTVAVVIFHAHQSGPFRIALGVGCIAASWTLLHTIYTLRYARLFYEAPRGGVDFKQDVDPTFRDFAYVAFTIGMTFQVSDTDIGKPAIRSAALGHALMAFVFGTIIIAVTINLVAGLSK